MAKASPARRNFNAGEFSILVEGRTDIDKYGASMRKMVNCIAAPQGPCLSRSGTLFIAENYDASRYSTLVPFIFNDTEAFQMEFGYNTLNFVFDSGVQINGYVTTAEIVTLSPLRINAPAFVGGATVGMRIALNGYPTSYNLNGRFAFITGIAGNIITLSISSNSAVVGIIAAQIASVFVIATPYTDADARNIRAVQDQDVVYLFCKGYQPRVLKRFSAYNWTLTVKQFNSGPFMSEVTNSGTLTISSTGDILGSGSGTATGGTNPGNALTDDYSTYWDSGNSQMGTWQFQYGTPTAVNGYVIYPAYVNNDVSYAAVDYAPGTWTFEASNDGVSWIVLDTQKNYVVYDGKRSGWFQFANTTAYAYYRLVVLACTRNGAINVRMSRIKFSASTPPTIGLSLSGNSTDFNGGSGFQTTDVGRLIRMKGADGYYRLLQINGYTNSTNISAQLQSEPFLASAGGITSTSEWSPGYFSDTTGWPSLGTFFDDRLWTSGVASFPGLCVGSRVGNYDDFLQKTSLDEVLDDGAIAVTVKSRKVSDVRWLESDERGLLLGTGTGEFVISPNNQDQALTARNVKGRASTVRGSAFIEPVKVDNNILHVHVSRRSAREFSYTFNSDGYVSRSMNLFASHLGVPQFAQMVYAAEPHSIVWFRRDDGSVVGFTYNKEEDVLGWHQHDFSGIVESMSVIPSSADIQDALWMVIRRTINGQTVRYIEKLTRFWDFDSTTTNMHYVDCGLRYNGPPVSKLYGLTHLEGQTVHGVFNGVPWVEDIVVTNGAIDCPFEDVTTAVVGLGFEALGEISNIEAGAADGTAQGKVKRIHNVAAHVWQMAYGEVGIWDEERDEYSWTDIEYKEAYDELTPITLQTQVLKPINMPPGYGNRGSVAFRQTLPLPMNIVALYPQLNTQDR